jgi:hypothetical protein
MSGRAPKLVCVAVADQGLERHLVSRPGRHQGHVSVLGTSDRRQPRRDRRLERQHVRLAPGTLGKVDGLAGAPAVRAWESRSGPEAQAQIDSSAFEVQVAAHHSPRRLELQRKLEELLHAPHRHSVGHDGHRSRPTLARRGSFPHIRGPRLNKPWRFGATLDLLQGRRASAEAGHRTRRLTDPRADKAGRRGSSAPGTTFRPCPPLRMPR